MFAHPVRDSFVGSLFDRVTRTLTESGVEVRVIDLYAEQFEPAMTLAQHRTYIDGIVPTALQAHVDSLLWADAIVLVYPTWFGTQPSILKGWFDRVWLPGVAFETSTGSGRLKPKLQNIRSIIVVTSHGSGKFMNSVQGEPGKRTALRGIRSLCGLRCRGRWIAFYKNDRATDADRRAFLDRMATKLSKVVA